MPYIDVSTSPLSTIESTEEELKTMLQAVTAAESKYSLDLLVALAPTMTFIIEQVGKPAPGSMCLLSEFRMNVDFPLQSLITCIRAHQVDSCTSEVVSHTDQVMPSC